MAPGLALFMDTSDAVVTVVLLSALTALQMVPPAVRIARWRDIGPMAVAAMLAVPLGGLVLATVDGGLVRRGIGVVVLAFTLVLFAGWRMKGERRLPTTLAVGMAAGLLTGAGGIGGPPVVLYLLSGDRPMAENRAGFIVFFALCQVAAFPVFLSLGLVRLELLWPLIALAPAYMGGTYLGTQLFRRASEQIYRQMALAFMAAVAVAVLVV